MRFVNDISQIGEVRCGEPCYCEYLMYPSDLQLQAGISRATGVSYSLNVYLYDRFGNTQIADITSFFSWWVADTPGGRKLTLKLNSFPATMCAASCFTLRVVLTGTSVIGSVFDRFTDVYCIKSCCDYPTGITSSQEGVTPQSPVDFTFTLVPDAVSDSGCIPEMIRIRGRFECLDVETAYYGTPGSAISSSGALFAYDPVSVIEGGIKHMPRDIHVSMSYNCKVQRVESFKAYIAESHELVPAWKMYEIENTLQAQDVIIEQSNPMYAPNSPVFKFIGGEAFEQPVAAWNRFKLNANIRICTRRIDYGCGEPCVSGAVATLYYAIPAAYDGGGYYNDNRQYIATNNANLILYMQAQDGVTSVTDVTANYTGYYIVLEVETENSIALPVFLYYDNVFVQNKVYANQQEPSNIVVTCAPVTIGAVTSENITCAKPIIGEVVSESMLSETEVFITFQNGWEQGFAQPWIASVAAGVVRISRMDAINYGYPYDPPTFPAEYFANEFIGTLSANARPSQTRIISFEDDRTFTIDTFGNMYYSGSPDFINSNLSAVHIGDHTPNTIRPEVFYEL